MAHDFEQVSVAALPANLPSLPAIAPVMWLGMAMGMLGQLPVASADRAAGLVGSSRVG